MIHKMVSSVIDACVHQWTLDYEELGKMMSDPWGKKMGIKAQMRHIPSVGSAMTLLPWHHAFWNEDAPETDTPAGEYTNSEQYKSPEKMDRRLAETGVETAILAGHEIRFLPSIASPDFATEIAAGYNELLTSRWLESYDRFKGSIVVAMNDPDAAAAEIAEYADHPDVVSVLLFGGWDRPFGHQSYRPVYEAAVDADLPLTIHTSGNPTTRQTAMGIPEHYVTHDTNLSQNHAVNLVSMVMQGVFEDHPDLDVVWAGEGIDWALHPMWRATRYYRNFEPQVPRTLEREPHEQIRDSCYFVSYPVGGLPAEKLTNMIELVGIENLLYGSGYPDWHSDTLKALPELGNAERSRVFQANAKEVYGL